MEDRNGDAKFKAFISYRHVDNARPGRRWAEWLHSNLEGYRIPVELRGRPNRHGAPVPGTLYPIFRDEEEIATGASLGALVEEGLQESEWLIVLCSPRSAESFWVNSEVSRFQELGRSHKILSVLLDGVPNATALSVAGGVEATLECLPHALRMPSAEPPLPLIRGTARDTLLGVKQELAADFRPEGGSEEGFTSAAAYRKDLELRNVRRASPLTRSELRALEDRYDKRLKLMLLKIISALLDVDLAELTKRDAEARARRARLIALVAASVGAVIACLGAFAFWQSSQRKEQLRSASRMEYEQGFRYASGGQSAQGLLHLASALRFNPENSDAAWLMGNLMIAEQGKPRLTPRWTDLQALRVRRLAFSPDSEWLVVGGDGGGVYRYKVDQWPGDGAPKSEQLHFFSEGGLQAAEFTADGGHLVLANGEGAVCIFSTETWRQSAKLQHDGVLVGLATSPSSDCFITFGQGSPKLWCVKDGQSVDLLGVDPGRIALQGKWSSDGRRFAVVADDGAVHVWRLVAEDRIGQCHARHLGSVEIEGCLSLEFSPSGAELACGGPFGIRILSSIKPDSPHVSRGIGQDGIGVVTLIRWYQSAGKEVVSCRVLSGRAPSFDGTLLTCPWDQSDPPQMDKDGSGFGCLEVHPHGILMVTGGGDGVVRLRHPWTGSVIASTNAAAETTALRWSPDGSWLAVGMMQGGVSLSRLEGSCSTTVLRSPDGISRGFSANGEWEVIETKLGYVCQATSRPQHTVSPRFIRSSLEKAKAAVSDLGTFQILWEESSWQMWGVGEDGVPREVVSGKERVVGAAFHPLRNLAAISLKGGEVRIVDVSTGNVVNVIFNGGDGWPLAFDDERVLVVGGLGTVAAMWDHTIVNKWDGKEVLKNQPAFVKMIPALGRVHSLSFAYDGTLSVGAPNMAVRIDPTSLEDKASLSPATGCQVFRWSGDGRTGAVVHLSVPSLPDHRYALLEPKAWRPAVWAAVPSLVTDIAMTRSGDNVIVVGRDYRLERPVFVPPADASDWVPDLVTLIFRRHVDVKTGELRTMPAHEWEALRAYVLGRCSSGSGGWSDFAAWILTDPMERRVFVGREETGGEEIARLVLSGTPQLVIDAATMMPQHPLVPAAMGGMPGLGRATRRALAAESLRRCQRNPAWSRDLVRILWRSKLWAETLKAVDLVPLVARVLDAEVLQASGECHYELGRFQEALSDFRRAKQLDPGSGRHVRSEAWSLFCLKRHAEAASAFKAAASLVKTMDKDLLIGLACSHHVLPDPKAAADYYAQLVQMDAEFGKEGAIADVSPNEDAGKILMQIHRGQGRPATATRPQQPK